MKPFSIQDLEKYIEPDIFDLGLKLIEDGTLAEIKELENNLWIGKVSDDIEVEIQVARNRIKSYSCDCEVAQNGDLCNHLAASMILLRRVKATPVKRTKSTKKTKPKKITTANILNMASEEELKDFVRKYARSNRQFSVSLKTKFAHLFESEDLETKYNQVLETIIKAQVGRSSYLKTVRLRRLLKNLDELLNQAEDALAKKHFADVFALLSAFIHHVVPVIWKSNGEDIVERLDRAFLLINRLVDNDLSPELETKIKTLFIEECPKFKYRSGETTARFFYALVVLYQRAGDLETLADFVENQVDGTWGKWLAAKWQVLRYRLAKALENKERMDLVLSESLKNRFLFDRMLHDAEKRNDKETLKLLIDSAEENNQELLTKITSQTEKILLNIAREEKNKREITKYAKKLFLDTLDMQYFELLKQNSSKRRWRITFENLIKTMLVSNKLWVHKEAVAELLIKEKRFSQLFSYISKSKSLTLIVKYKSQLLASDKEEFQKLFEYLIMDFAKNYIGGNSAKHIIDAIQALKNHKLGDYTSNLIQQLKENYPERKSLMSQLETL